MSKADLIESMLSKVLAIIFTVAGMSTYILARGAVLMDWSQYAVTVLVSLAVYEFFVWLLKRVFDIVARANRQEGSVVTVKPE